MHKLSSRFIVIVLLFMSLHLFILKCDHKPTGPNIAEYKTLAVFGIINPSVKTQNLLVARTLSLNEVNSDFTGSLEVSNISGRVSGPDGDMNFIAMQKNSQSQQDTDIRSGNDFLPGSGHFNYLLDGQKFRTGESYNLFISSEEYGSVHASTTIPKDFEITEINIEPSLSSESVILTVDSWGQVIPEFKPQDFRVQWSASDGAAGYLVDLTIMEYDIPEDLSFNYDKGGLWWPEIGDSSQLIQIPYTEIPVDFATSEDVPRRGILTNELKIEFPLSELLELVNFPKEYEYRFYHIIRLRVYVHALTQALYDYIAFQYLPNTGDNEIIGQEFFVPDISNIENGVGIWGGVNTRSATSRFCDYIFQPDYFGQGDKSIDYWYEQFNELLSIDQILNDEFSRYLFPSGTNPPILQQPENNSILSSNEGQLLSWEPVEGAGMYLLVVKLHYLWFAPGNVSFLTEENQYEIFWNDFPYRDCELEWYVKAFSGNYHTNGYLAEVPPDKATLVLSNEVATPWSESRFIITESGELAGFEECQPIIVTPKDGDILPELGKLEWEEINGADAYLVYIYSPNGQYITAVTQETEISPPFPNESEYIDGLRGINHYNSGETYHWQICALRVKSGALGIVIGDPDEENPLQIYPRYQHPSGIVLQSRWSEVKYFTVQ